ncbi:UPF0052-domain-containing protein [Thelephora ganbajun]|uniref:UPF0052-domain-containing protein n=1 Tax=Thelephora ganbajun TaxID=370292 RepID=A0ACB6ZPP5_THEGA|nr:UPF0052-domain-containing protein [Thelephora ganbajun]
MTLSIPNNPSPGSSIFDFPAHRETAYTVQTPQGNTRASSSLVPHLADDHGSYVVISGGTGCNPICSAFGLDACYVLPISDDGGSSSEIIRVLGGPSIGDIRSRLIRLIPAVEKGSPLDAIRTLLAHRLSSNASEKDAREEWRDIVEGRSSLWAGIPSDRKEMIRGFLVHFESELLKRAHKNFSFTNGSIGNYFLAAAQGFFRSLPSAIFLFSSITHSQANILPIIVTNHTVTIAAELVNGEKIIGQCEISHPVHATPVVSVVGGRSGQEDPDSMGQLLVQQKNVLFGANGKGATAGLPSPISRIYYINAYGNEIHPYPNPDFLINISLRQVLVYSCGSLWTSIMPCLALRGVAKGIAKSHSLKAKVLLLNSKNDRETEGYTAVDFINAIVRMLNSVHDMDTISMSYPTSAFITHLVYLYDTEVAADVQKITSMGVKCVEVRGVQEKRFDSGCLQHALKSILAEVM